MAGIGSYEKGKAFTLKSGNKPSFKNVGSSLKVGEGQGLSGDAAKKAAEAEYKRNI